MGDTVQPAISDDWWIACVPANKQFSNKTTEKENYKIIMAELEHKNTN